MWFPVVYIIVASLFILCFLFKKLRTFVAIILVSSILFACTLTLHGALAEALIRKVEGTIIRVAPEYCGYPMLIVTVESIDGEIYTYYAEDEIDVTGIITLVLFGDEVIDVI